MTTHTLFDNLVPSIPDFTADGTANGLNLGTVFVITSPGLITHIRYYKSPGETGPNIGRVYNSSLALLQEITFTGESASGWQTQALSSPIAVSVGAFYMVAVFRPTTAHYPKQETFFATRYTNGPIYGEASASVPGIGNGCYSYNASPTPPTNTFNASCYFVDIVFDDGITPMAITSPSGQNTTLDLFQRADNASMGSNWSTDPSGCGNSSHTIVSNHMNAAAQYVENLWGATVFDADQEVFIKVPALLDSQGVGLLLRVDTNSGYETFLRRNGSDYELTHYSFTPGCTYENTSIVLIPFASDLYFGVTVIGDTLKTYTSADGVSWVLRDTTVWNKHSGAGSIGVYTENANLGAISLDDFGGGSINPPTPPAPDTDSMLTYASTKLILGLL